MRCRVSMPWSGNGHLGGDGGVERLDDILLEELNVLWYDKLKTMLL